MLTAEFTAPGPAVDLADGDGPGGVLPQHASRRGLLGVVALGLGQELPERLHPQPEAGALGRAHPQLPSPDGAGQADAGDDGPDGDGDEPPRAGVGRQGRADAR